MELVLHNYRRCPYCIRTRMLLALKQIPCTLFDERLRDWSPWMLEWSSNAQERPRVPVLKGEGTDFAMPESNDINIWLDSRFGPPTFTPVPGSEADRKMRQWWKWFDEKLQPVLVLYKYGKNRKFNAEENILHTIQLTKTLETLEEGLSSPYLLGNKLSLADIAILPFIYQIQRVRDNAFDFSGLPKLTVWAQSVLTTPWFIDEVMKKQKK